MLGAGESPLLRLLSWFHRLCRGSAEGCLAYQMQFLRESEPMDRPVSTVCALRCMRAFLEQSRRCRERRRPRQGNLAVREPCENRSRV